MFDCIIPGDTCRCLNHLTEVMFGCEIFPFQCWSSCILRRVNPLHPEGLRGGYSGLPCPSWWPVSGQRPPGYMFPPRCDESQVRSRVPHWDLAVVLEALCRPPFESIEEISERLLTSKTVLLLAIYSLKRVGDLQAFSVSPSYLDFAPDLVKAFLFPGAGYVPKVPFSTPQPIVLNAFCPLPFREPDQKRLNCMCPVEHWMRASTELPCGEGRTNCWYAMVPLRRVFPLPSRPSVGG